MSNSLKASNTGLEIVNQARKRLGWTKSSTARWWQDAHTSRATLRRFWHGDRIQKEIFIAICAAVGISNWENIADIPNLNHLNQENYPIYLNWHQVPNLESFFGREQELSELVTWINNDYKYINLYGITGIGKTALSLALVDKSQNQFEFIFWQSVNSQISIIEFLTSLLKSFQFENTEDLETATFYIVEYLTKNRCLIILDGIDTIANNSELSDFLQKLSLYRHQSCIIITSREKQNISEVNTKIVANLKLTGLSKEAALELLNSRGCIGKELSLLALIQLYRGNPLGLKLVTPFIQTGFSGNVSAFINQNTIIVGDRLTNIINQQLNKLSILEKDILYWLAIWQEPISFVRLQTHFLISMESAKILSAIVDLENKSLLETWVSDEQNSFSLQPLVMKVVIDKLIETATQEIQKVIKTEDISYLQILHSHWLLRPGTDDISGDKIINQLRENLNRIYGAGLQQRLTKILSLLENQSPLTIGYITANIVSIQ